MGHKQTYGQAQVAEPPVIKKAAPCLAHVRTK